MRAVTLVTSALLLAAAPSPGHRGLPFYGPDNVAVDARGNIFVTDSDHRRNFRVVEFNAHRAYLAEWHVFRVGAPPSGPEGITVDERGRIFVTDAGARRVLELSPSGKILAIFGGDGLFVNPGHVAVDRRGFVYVADAGANAVTRFSPDGRILETWRRAHGSGRADFSGPESIAVSAQGTLFVEDWGNHRIVELASNGTTLRTWGPGTGDARIGNSAGIAVDRSGRVYVADWGRHRIEVFGAGGAFLGAIANVRHAAPRFVDGPTSVYVDARGRVYYADGNTIRIIDGKPAADSLGSAHNQVEQTVGNEDALANLLAVDLRANVALGHR